MHCSANLCLNSEEHENWIVNTISTFMCAIELSISASSCGILIAAEQVRNSVLKVLESQKAVRH